MFLTYTEERTYLDRLSVFSALADLIKNAGDGFKE